MTKLESMLERLPAAQRQQVEAFAADLLRKDQNAPVNGADHPNRIQFDKLAGMLTQSRSDSDREDERQARDAWADAAED